MQWLLVILELCFHGHHGNVSKILVNNRSFRHANLSTETQNFVFVPKVMIKRPQFTSMNTNCWNSGSCLFDLRDDKEKKF